MRYTIYCLSGVLIAMLGVILRLPPVVTLAAVAFLTYPVARFVEDEL